jgi:3' terminal RNA ribose 2'-O-methyltransferase Hen1
VFLSIAAQGEGADKLSYVMQKHPAKVFERESLKLFFPVYNEEKKLANFVSFVEFPEYKLWNADTANADAYVTSREYALSSLFCRELKKAFNTVLNQKYKDPDDAAAAQVPLDLTIEALPLVTSLSDDKINDLFRPLGYEPLGAGLPGVAVDVKRYFVDHSYRHQWQPQKTRVLGLTLRCKKPLREVLQHLLVLIPVIDNYTHYTKLDPLVEELKLFGGSWLESHPKKDYITARFLRFRKRLIKQAGAGEDEKKVIPEVELEKQLNLGEMRVKWFVDQVQALKPRSVVDAGCGSGRLAEKFVEANILEVMAFDCDPRAIRTANKFLKNKANVFFSSLMYFDPRLLNKDVFCLQEVIEHMPAFQLSRALDLIFKVYQPKVVLMTTPNRDYNVRFGMKEGEFRHWDHKFEFTERDASTFMTRLAKRFSYDAEIKPVGEAYVPKPEREGESKSNVMTISAPTATAPTFGFVFTRRDSAA